MLGRTNSSSTMMQRRRSSLPSSDYSITHLSTETFPCTVPKTDWGFSLDSLPLSSYRELSTSHCSALHSNDFSILSTETLSNIVLLLDEMDPCQPGDSSPSLGPTEFLTSQRSAFLSKDSSALFTETLSDMVPKTDCEMECPPIEDVCKPLPPLKTLPYTALDAFPFAKRSAVPDLLPNEATADFVLNCLESSEDDAVPNGDGEYNFHNVFTNRCESMFFNDLPGPALQSPKMRHWPTPQAYESVLSPHNEAATTRVTETKDPNDKNREQQGKIKSHHPVPEPKEYVPECTEMDVQFVWDSSLDSVPVSSYRESFTSQCSALHSNDFSIISTETLSNIVPLLDEMEPFQPGDLSPSLNESTADSVLNYLKSSADDAVTYGYGSPSSFPRQNNVHNGLIDKHRCKFFNDLPGPAVQCPKMLQYPTPQPFPSYVSVLSPHNEAATTRVAETKDSNDKNREQQGTAKSHHPVPKHKKYVQEYSAHDVLFGRGSRTNNHPGNIIYRELVEVRKERYKQVKGSTKIAIAEKDSIASEIVNIIQKKYGGRFLDLDIKEGRYFVSHPKALKGKVKQALRDKNDPETRAIKRATYPKK